MGTCYYFGWCTWMYSGELHRYWPDAKIVRKGHVNNWSVQWKDAGGRGDRGWCHLDNLQRSWGKRTLGIIVEIPEFIYGEEFDDFDVIALTVIGDDGRPYDCWTYTLAHPGNDMKAPWYYWDNCVAGLNEHQLPYAYIREYLQTYEAAPDGPRMNRPNPHPGRPGKSANER